MPLFKVSVESQVPVSAVVVSNAPTEAEALTEVRLLQSRARVNWRRGPTPIGAIEAPYEIWAHKAPDGSYTVSLYAVIPVSAQQSVIAEDSEAVSLSVSERQDTGLIPWTYRGVPIGEYTEDIPTFWSNQQPDAATAATLALSSTSLFPGQSVTMFSDVSGSETPVGNLEFVDTTSGGVGTIVLTSLERDPVTAGLSHAQSVVVLPAGVYSVKASYVGSDGFQPSASAEVTLTVAKVNTSVVITPPTPPLYAGQSVSLNIQVNQSEEFAPQPTGVLTLFAGTTVIGSTQLGAGAFGSFSLGALPPGTYSFTVQYDGDDIHNGSSGTVAGIVVQQATTTATLSILDSGVDVAILTSAFSQTIRLRATVTSIVPGTRPTGTVTFFKSSFFAPVAVGTATLVPDLSSSNLSKVEILLSNLSVEAHQLFIQYGGNASFAASASSFSTLTVAKANVFVSAFSTNSPTKFGQTAVFDATVGVFEPANLTPFQQYGVGGAVTYKDSSMAVVNFDGSGHAARSNSGLSVGLNEVGVTFSATAEYNSGFVPFYHVVEKADTSTNVIFNQEPVSWFTTWRVITTVSTVSPGIGTPTGTVSISIYDPWYYGNLFLGSGSLVAGVLDKAVSFFAVFTDNYLVTVSYSGDAGRNPSVGTRSMLVFGYYF